VSAAEGRGRVHWWWRGAGALLLYAVLEVTLTLAGYAPDALRLALLVCVGVTATGLVLDGMVVSGPALWTEHPVPSVVPPGADVRLGAYVRLVEDHLSSPTPGAALRDRLVTLSDGRLAEELSGPPRRLSRAEIDDYLRRIEQR
jgi:hypothetical protein